MTSQAQTTRRSASTASRADNSTLDDDDVHVARRSDYTSSEAIINELEQQETVSPLEPEYCCDAGDHGFRTYKTEFPVIRSADIEPGLLVYRPTTSPLTVYELTSEPYTNEHGSRRVDVIAHSRAHAGADAAIRTREDSVFLASVVDEMTFLTPSTVQQTLPTTSPQ